MRLPRECYQMEKTIETHLPHLSQPQLTGLALWVCGAILAGSAGQNAVASALSPWSNWHNLRQRLREWLYDGGDRATPCQTELDVTLCFAPLAAVGPLLVAVGRPSFGHRPHPQRGPDHRHRHRERALSQLRHPRGLAHPARRPAAASWMATRTQTRRTTVVKQSMRHPFGIDYASAVWTETWTFCGKPIFAGSWWTASWYAEVSAQIGAECTANAARSGVTYRNGYRKPHLGYSGGHHGVAHSQAAGDGS